MVGGDTIDASRMNLSGRTFSSRPFEVRKGIVIGCGCWIHRKDSQKEKMSWIADLSGAKRWWRQAALRERTYWQRTTIGIQQSSPRTERSCGIPKGLQASPHY